MLSVIVREPIPGAKVPSNRLRPRDQPIAEASQTDTWADHVVILEQHARIVLNGGMVNDMRQAIYSEIAKGLRLLRAPPESVAVAESFGDSFAISATFERCEAPTAYLVAVGSHSGIQEDEDTLELLISLNQFIAEIAGDANTHAEVMARLKADKRLSFPKVAVTT